MHELIIFKIGSSDGVLIQQEEYLGNFWSFYFLEYFLSIQYYALYKYSNSIHLEIFMEVRNKSPWFVDGKEFSNKQCISCKNLVSYTSVKK